MRDLSGAARRLPSRVERGQESGRHVAQPQTRRSSTCRDATRERKSEPRTAQPRVQSEDKSLGATLHARAAEVRAATTCEGVSRSSGPTLLRRERGQETGRLGATPPDDAPQQCSTNRDAERERKSKPRTAHPRIQSERKSLGATPPNRRRAAAVRAAMLCKSVSRSCAPPTLACRGGQELGATPPG